jgi:hypothetical protein
VTAKAASLVPLLLMLSAAGAPARPLEQLLPLPPIAAPPVPAPSPPPVNPGAPAAPPQGISPLLLQPGGPVFTQPRPLSQPAPPPLSAPIDQQKTTSYQMWLAGQLRLLERSGQSPADPLYRELQQQLLQLDQSGGPP